VTIPAKRLQVVIVVGAAATFGQDVVGAFTGRGSADLAHGFGLALLTADRWPPAGVTTRFCGWPSVPRLVPMGSTKPALDEVGASGLFTWAARDH
jgi:hypothetical protein